MAGLAKNYIAAVFDNPEKAFTIVEDLNQHDYPMDQVSVLYKAGGLGDDFLGIAYTNEKQRFRVWGAGGAIWGSLCGLLAGAAGMFLLPGIGPVLIAGPLLDAIVGGALGAGIMTTGAALTHLSIALRRLGMPDDKLDVLHQAVIDGKTVLLLHCGDDDPQFWKQRLAWGKADAVFTLP